MTIKENLIRAKALIPDKAHWACGTYRVVRSDGEFCYCTLGAVSAALDVEMGVADHSPEAKALRLALPGDWRSVSAFNDRGATFADIHALFDRAIGAQP